MGSNTKKHKKHKRERSEEHYSIEEKPPALKLILKVGGGSGGNDLPNANAMLSHHFQQQQQQQQQQANFFVNPGESEYDRYLGHKKLKKKKKKKDKRHKHHHKEKKRKRDESSQELIDDDNHGEPAAKKPAIGTPQRSQQPDQKPINNALSPHREPRSCVLRKIAEKTPLQRLLEHLLRSMEKRDPQQFFAWPVTDNIAPGYSQIITSPMDFSTIKQKIDDNNYATLNDFVDDFKLMCNNATTYNQSDTIYYKAAKKLLHVGLKMVTPDKLKQLRPVLTYMSDISREELGFELGAEDPNNPDVPMTEEQIEKEREQEERNEEAEELRKENQRKSRLANLSKFEAIPDDLTPEEILQQVKGAAQAAAEKLSIKRVSSKMGFLRQKKDGTTSLQIIVPGDGVIPGTNQRPVSLGQLIGKLTHGTGALAGFREDRRNMSKPVKPLYYGAFGSYAPNYDSTFANLTKEESDLVYQTYGDENAAQYAESIIDFAKGCDYTVTIVDDLLDILTNGDHRKTKKVIEEKKTLKEEEDKIQSLLQSKPIQPDVNRNIQLEKVKVDVHQLKTLSELGIDVNFLDAVDEQLNSYDEKMALQNRLDDTAQLLGNLRQVQHNRLSLPPPAHLTNVLKPQENEVSIAEKITDNLTMIAKKLPPSTIAPVEGLRRAMGIAPVGAGSLDAVDRMLPETAIIRQTSTSSNEENDLAESLMSAQPSTMDNAAMLAAASVGQQNESLNIIGSNQMQIAAPMTNNNNSSNNNNLLGATETSSVPDLESELREFLESDHTLGHSPLQDDKTLEDILSES